jgi:predicted transcriptional regulator
MDLGKLLKQRDVRDILMVASKKPLSARRISDLTGIPIANCYRRLRMLVAVGLIEIDGYQLLGQGRSRNLFRSRIERLELFLHGDRLKGKLHLPTPSTRTPGKR